MRSIKFATVVGVALMSMAGVTQADTLAKVKESGVFTIGHRDASIPLSYYDDKQKPIGYSVEICQRVADAVKKELKKPDLQIKYQLVTSANRIPLLANGTVDIECGSTTNNAERQKQVSYLPTTFVTANRIMYKKGSGISVLADMKGKTLVSTAGTTNIKQVTQINAEKNLGVNITSANGHAESFLMVETGRAAAFAMDDILLAGLIATSKNPGQFEVSKEALSVEPYGIMVRKDDAKFEALAAGVVKGLMKSGEINKIYDKWFLKPIPPKNITMNVPMSPNLKKVIANPTNSPDPAAYQ
ncbi:MAG: amino acid ABC transporter substrate-binding protein [Burkholderiaceae bacterium]|jgi:glutamate/aspartate transport system substrate-binding protein|nr:transporter substrate-binding domain-containing protein [Burkholderiales bacterium LSUCC0115]